MSGRTSGPPGRGRRVLVVDDEAPVRHALERALTRRGEVVVSASSGEEGFEALSTQQVDVVLLDLRMPTMSGQTLFYLILSRWPELAKRVCVISGDPQAEDHHPWLKIHELTVLAKPFEMERLFAVIDALTAGAGSPGNESRGDGSGGRS